MIRLLLLGVVSLALAAPASAVAPTLTGTVGPGFTITLKKGTKKVTTLKAGRYRLVVRDKSNIHDFHLKGPGLNKVFTSVSFVGTKTFRVTLKPGRYSFVCDPHSSIMHGRFTVTR